MTGPQAPPSSVASGDARPGGGGAQDAAPLTPERLREQLARAGFREVRILDAAYLVRAVTQDGQTVVMMVNPPTMAAGLPGGVPGTGPAPARKPPPLTGAPAGPPPDASGGGGRGGGLETPLPGGTGPERRTDGAPVVPPSGAPGPSGGTTDAIR
jgi:hypothetical protein